MELKFKILAVHPESRSITINYYTDALVLAQQSFWEDRKHELMHNNPEWSEEQALIQAQLGWPVGSKLNLVIWPDPMPTGDELIQYILRHAPGDWLVTKSRAMTQAPDMSELEAQIGIEHSAMITADMAPVTMGPKPTPAEEVISLVTVV